MFFQFVLIIIFVQFNIIYTKTALQHFINNKKTLNYTLNVINNTTWIEYVYNFKNNHQAENYFEEERLTVLGFFKNDTCKDANRTDFTWEFMDVIKNKLKFRVQEITQLSHDTIENEKPNEVDIIICPHCKQFKHYVQSLPVFESQ